MQIGEVADRVGLSLRTIRFYEETGIVIPSARSAGGFRLYSESDVERLLLIKQLKPLGFSVEEIGKILTVLDAVTDRSVTGRERSALFDDLAAYHSVVEERIEQLTVRLADARELSAHLREAIDAG